MIVLYTNFLVKMKEKWNFVGPSIIHFNGLHVGSYKRTPSMATVCGVLPKKREITFLRQPFPLQIAIVPMVLF